ELARLSPIGISEPDELFQLAAAASSVSRSYLALPFLRAAGACARAHGRMNLLFQTLAFEAWAEVRRGAVRDAITRAAEGARIAEEIRAHRYVVAAWVAQAIASAEQGERDTSERLIAEAEAVLVPLGATPLLALTAFARGRVALAEERFGEAHEHSPRIFSHTSVAFHPFVQGWAIAALGDAAILGDGDVDAVRSYLSEWEQIAT